MYANLMFCERLKPTYFAWIIGIPWIQAYITWRHGAFMFSQGEKGWNKVGKKLWVFLCNYEKAPIRLTFCFLLVIVFVSNREKKLFVQKAYDRMKECRREIHEMNVRPAFLLFHSPSQWTEKKYILHVWYTYLMSKHHFWHLHGF